jgi:ribosome-associated protein
LTEEARARAERVWLEADRRKGIHPVVLDVGKLTIICDCFVVVTGRSLTHIEALAEGIIEGCEEHGILPTRKTSAKDAKWVVLDLGDVVVHIFSEDARRYYDLEGLWSDAEVIVLEGMEDPDGERVEG